MSMTKKDFSAIAKCLNDEIKQREAIANSRKDAFECMNDEIDGIEAVAYSLLSVFAELNPRFDSGRFMDAVLKDTGRSEEAAA